MAKKFWTFIGNDKYDIGLTSRTIYVYDKSGTELATFKDLIYAYDAQISPSGDIFVVKTTDGKLAVYSFDSLKLVKKFRFSKIDYGQDENMIFSIDGKYLYNIEGHTNNAKTVLTKYKIDDFSVVSKLFENNDYLHLSTIEYDENTASYYVSGFLCNAETKKADTWFVSKLVNDELIDMRYVTKQEEAFGSAITNLKAKGYTEKAFEWSPFKFLKVFDERFNITLDEIKQLNYSLATMWESASTKPKAE